MFPGAWPMSWFNGFIAPGGGSPPPGSGVLRYFAIDWLNASAAEVNWVSTIPATDDRRVSTDTVPTTTSTVITTALHPDDQLSAQRPTAHRQRAHSAGRSRYPTPRTVWIIGARPASIFLRRYDTYRSTMLDLPPKS